MGGYDILGKNVFKKFLVVGIICIFFGLNYVQILDAKDNENSIIKKDEKSMGYSFYFVNVTVSFTYNKPMWSFILRMFAEDGYKLHYLLSFANNNGYITVHYPNGNDVLYGFKDFLLIRTVGIYDLNGIGIGKMDHGGSFDGFAFYIHVLGELV